MIKVLIRAIFLSQALMQGVSYAADDDTRWINNTHRERLGHIAVVVPKDGWDTPKAPVPYWFFWTCSFEGQTAQQCVALHSMLDEELGK